METFPVLLTLVSGLIAALLIFAAVKFMRSLLAELREIGPDASIEVDDVSPRPETTPAKSDAADTLLAAQNIIIIPGYGMGVSQAHFRLWALARALGDHGKNVSFAIHPAAGRMPGHMNFLLDEAEVPRESMFDLENINDRFAACDLALIVGANDIVNPAARTDKDSPIYGMPILNADKAGQIFVIKRGRGSGFCKIDNPLFTEDKARMLYGDAQDILQSLLNEVESQ